MAYRERPIGQDEYAGRKLSSGTTVLCSFPVPRNILPGRSWTRVWGRVENVCVRSRENGTRCDDEGTCPIFFEEPPPCRFFVSRDRKWVSIVGATWTTWNETRPDTVHDQRIRERLLLCGPPQIIASEDDARWRRISGVGSPRTTDDFRADSIERKFNGELVKNLRNHGDLEPSKLHG